MAGFSDLAEWLEDSYRRRAPDALRRRLDD